LQDHGNPVRYRNIWVREIQPIEGTRERGPYFHDHATGKDTPIERKTSSTQTGSAAGIEALANNSTINLGIGTPRLPGQVSGQLQLQATSTGVYGPAVFIAAPTIGGRPVAGNGTLTIGPVPGSQEDKQPQIKKPQQ
jgi:hypothetical protein